MKERGGRNLFDLMYALTQDLEERTLYEFGVGDIPYFHSPSHSWWCKVKQNEKQLYRNTSYLSAPPDLRLYSF